MEPEVKIVNWGFEPNPKGNLHDVRDFVSMENQKQPIDVVWDDERHVWKPAVDFAKVTCHHICCSG